jgi:beta-glucosidase
MKSYDAQQAKAYIMDEGDYFVTAAQDAHQAVNNILQAKGYSVDGDSSMVDTYVVSSFQTFDTDLATGYAVTNRFDDAIADDAVYLSRSNWSIMDNNGLNYSTGTAEGVSTTTDLAGTVGTHVASDELIAQISAVGWEASGIPEDAENNADVVDGAEGDLELIELRGLDFDDPLWEDLLDQVSVNEMYEMMATAGYATAAMDTISKPKCFDSDGPNGISNLVSGYACFGYPIETMLACTWNQELAQHYGEIIGEDCLQASINGWYAPAMNIHRTPFSGRNNEYYSEDATLSGRMATNTVIGANSKGLYTYIKHFALNDQETNRSSICTWAQEQAIREIYLRPFEMAVKEGGSTAIMMSMNRIGFRKTLGHYNLITGTLRGEWGFEGSVITDATNESGEIVDQALAAGTDLQLSTAANRLSDTSSNRIKNALRTATHDVLYTAVNSAAMNGIEKGTELSSTGVPVYMIIMIAIDAIVVIGVVLGEIFVLRKAKAIANGTANTEAVYQRADGKLMSCDYIAIASMVVAVLGLILEFTRIALVVGIALAVVGLIGAIVAKQQSKQYGKVKLVQNALTVCILAVVIAVAGGIGFWIYDVIMVRYFG